MTRAKQRRMDKLNREDVFMNDNSADFPKDSPGDKVTVQIRALMPQALALDADLTRELGERRAAQEEKDDSRDELLDLLRDVSTAALGLGKQIPGIVQILRVPDNRNDQNLISAATAFEEAIAPHEAKFDELGLENVREELINRRDAFAAARNEWASAVEEHAEAAASLDDVFRQMMELSRTRSAIIEIKYRNNPGKLAAWTVASHLERAPKTPKPPNA